MTAAGVPRSMAGVAFEARDAVNVGVVGLGQRSRHLLGILLRLDGVQIVAVHDPDEQASAAADALVTETGSSRPVVERSAESLIGRDDLDAVLIATPQDLHGRLALAVLESGKHVFTEVPAAGTVDECWRLVEASERQRRHCVMLENCCYGYNELLVLNMVKAGLFGQLTHAEGGYIHDCRELAERRGPAGRQGRILHNGNRYPTHGLGPVAMYLGINRGDRLRSLVSMSSPALGLAEWRDEHTAPESPMRGEVYQCGDMNTSIIKTELGRTILLQHQTDSPRPYSRLNVVSGTKGVFQDYPPRVYIEGQEGPEEFVGIDGYREEFEHRLWRERGSAARDAGGHGGMDYILLSRLIECVRQGLAPDLDVYDAVAWSVAGPLSEASVAADGAPVHFPDFTRGTWRDGRARIE